MFPKIGQPTTEDPLSLPAQSQKSKIFKAVTLDNEINGRTERYAKFRHQRK